MEMGMGDTVRARTSVKPGGSQRQRGLVSGKPPSEGTHLPQRGREGGDGTRQREVHKLVK